MKGPVIHIPYFTDYKMLWTIKCTLIFKQFKKNDIFTIFIIRLQSQAKKKFLVYKTELTFKISEICNFLQIFFTSPAIANGGGPKCRSAALFPCCSAYAITVLSICSLHHMNTFYFFHYETNKNIVLLPITQIIFNSSSLTPRPMP